MSPDLSVGALIGLLAALVLAGGVTGLLSGLLGVGGGGILVPVLYETFTFLDVDPAVRMHLTLGTSFAVIVPTSLRSLAGHYARGAVELPVLRRLAPWMMVGVAAGILIMETASSAALRAIWVVFGSLLCLRMALGRDDWRLADDLPRPPWAEGIVAAIGAVSTLMSIGGGAFMVTLLILFGRPLLRAIGTSSGFGPLIAVPGVAGYVWAGLGAASLPAYAFGYVHLLAAAIVAPACLVTVPWGVRLAHGLSKRRLEIAFALFLATVASRFALSLIFP